jgi:hypothetical protein
VAAEPKAVAKPKADVAPATVKGDES